MDCAYWLVNLPTQRCPECGRWFDPADPSTYQQASKKVGWRRLASSLSSRQCVIFAVLSLYGIVNASGPAQWEAGSICMVAFVGVPLWLGILLLYVVRTAATWLDRERAKLDDSERSGRWRWWVVPICAVLVVSSWIYPWPLLLRFRLSQTAFEAAVADYQMGATFRGKWVGLYYVKNAHPITYTGPGGRTTVGFVTGSNVLDPVGFEYDPLPNHPTGFMIYEVGKSWYTFED